MEIGSAGVEWQNDLIEDLIEVLLEALIEGLIDGFGEGLIAGLFVGWSEAYVVVPPPFPVVVTWFPGVWFCVCVIVASLYTCLKLSAGLPCSLNLSATVDTSNLL